MNGRLAVVISGIVLAAAACGSGDPGALTHDASRRAATPRVQTDGIAKVLHVATVDHAAAVEPAVTVAWSTEAEGAPVAVAADRRGEVVIIDHAQVAALDLTGNVLWATDFDWVASAVPVLTSDRVIVPFSRANGSGGCAGLDRATGELRWRYEAITSPGVAVARAGDRVLCLMRNGQTAAITPSWGSPQWEFTFQGDIDPSTIEVPAGTSIAVDEHSGVFAFVARVGDRWQLATRIIATGHTRPHLDLGSAGSPSAVALLAGGYFAVASDPGYLNIVANETQEFDRYPIPVRDGFDPASPPIIDDGTVIVVGREGEVMAFDLDSSRLRWTAQANSRLRGAHVIVLGKALMLQTWSGQLLAFRLRDGVPLQVPWDPGRAISMLFSGGPGVAIAVGEDGDVGWVEHWEPKPGF